MVCILAVHYPQDCTTFNDNKVSNNNIYRCSEASNPVQLVSGSIDRLAVLLSKSSVTTSVCTTYTEIYIAVSVCTCDVCCGTKNINMSNVYRDSRVN